MHPLPQSNARARWGAVERAPPVGAAEGAEIIEAPRRGGAWPRARRAAHSSRR